ncbi:MAG TPA: tyrosine-type recombinase/integrase [Verrucomicrobiae bacterium]|nr:tyrosine-type recombinase/integrase [Verrucomicrobiae bacterium]
MFDLKGNRKYLDGQEREDYRSKAERESDPARRAFSLTLFYTGCRISEALNLTVERIDLVGKFVVFETLKRRRKGCFRAVPIPDNLCKLLGELSESLPHGTRLWKFSRPTAYRLIKQHMRSAGIAGSRACPKGLRHSFAVACIWHKIPLPPVQKWMGHARMETTAIYLDVSGEEERALATRLWTAGNGQ